MRVGVDIPYLASAHDVRRYVQAMEELGFDHLGFSEHVCCTVDSQFPAPFFTFDEPWRETVTMATFVAAVTQRIEVNPAMMLMPLYHPVLAAKQLAEIAGLSEGRLRVAASIGWNHREAESTRRRPGDAGRPLRGADRGDATAVDRARRRPRRSVLRAASGRHQSPAGRVDPAVDGCRTHRPGRLPEPVRRAAGGRGSPTGSSSRRRRSSIAIRSRGHVDDLRVAVGAAGRDPEQFGIEVRMIAHETDAGRVERCGPLGEGPRGEPLRFRQPDRRRVARRADREVPAVRRRDPRVVVIRRRDVGRRGRRIGSGRDGDVGVQHPIG